MGIKKLMAVKRSVQGSSIAHTYSDDSTASGREFPSFFEGSPSFWTRSGSVRSIESVKARFESPAELAAALQNEEYLADPNLAIAGFLAIKLGQPLLLEGEPGVGKTAMAQALCGAMRGRLIRLQCFEGIDVHQALYEWDFSRQLLAIKAAEATHQAPDLYSHEHLLERPLLAALEEKGEVVLLIDELDRADDEFEALLLEFLSEFQISIPELGTVKAAHRPTVVITSNRTRELHDALKRRCLYHWIDYPGQARELAIVEAHLPGVSAEIARSVCAAAASLRQADLYKPPGIGEAIAWAGAISALDASPTDDTLIQTLGASLKVREDIEKVTREKILADA